MYEATIYADGKTEVLKVNEGEKVSNLIDKIKDKLKLFNFSFLYGGGKIEEEDYDKDIKEISNDIDKKDHKINIIGISNRTASLIDEENKSQIGNYNEVIKYNNNGENNMEKEKIFDPNLDANKKIYESNNVNEKILNQNNQVNLQNERYPKENIINENEDAIIDEQIPIKKRFVNICSGCDQDSIFFTKVFLFLIIEMLTIGLFVFLGCFFGINKVFNKNIGSKLGTFIPFFLFNSLYAITIIIGMDKKEDKQDVWCNSSSLIFYIPFIVFSSYLLSNYTKYEYILYEIGLICLSFLIMIIYVHLTNYYNYILLFFIHAIIITGVNILSYYFWIKKARVIVNISIIEVVIIIYILVVFCDVQKYSPDYCFYTVLFFSYLFILVTDFIILITIYLLFSLLSWLFKGLCGEE